MELHKHQDYANRWIRRVARKMIGKAGFLEADYQDIQQDLWLDLLERFPRYRPERGNVKNFIATVVKHRSASIFEARKAAKRNGGIRPLSLDLEIEDIDGEEGALHENISVDDYLRRTRGTIRTECERQDLAIDLRKVIERKPAHIHVALILLVDETASSAACTVGIPRTTLRDMIQSLRKDGDVEELRKYFK